MNVKFDDITICDNNITVENIMATRLVNTAYRTSKFCVSITNRDTHDNITVCNVYVKYYNSCV